ncbi:MAG: hypothetical protein JKY37_19785 [Nannocystaceae bacterium]|nr:hypothetical protein [Nannocystaceae bacterium]
MIALISGVAACAGQSTSHDQSGSAAETESATHGAADPGTTGTDSTSGPPATSTDGAEVDTETPSSSDSGTLDDSTSGGVPFPRECYEPDPLIVVELAETPDGPIEIEEAWYLLDYCSSIPHVILVQPPSVEFGPARELDVEVRPDSGFPLVGVHSAAIAWEEATGTIEFLSPYEDSDIGTPDASKRLHAQIEIHEAGWELSVQVDLIYCGFAECYCPCR